MSYENFHLPNGFRASPFNYQRKQASVVKFNEIYFDLKVIKIDNLILHYLASILVKFEEKLSIFLFQNIYLIFVDYGEKSNSLPLEGLHPLICEFNYTVRVNTTI
jgi:hypothetical protein